MIWIQYDLNTVWTLCTLPVLSLLHSKEIKKYSVSRATVQKFVTYFVFARPAFFFNNCKYSTLHWKMPAILHCLQKKLLTRTSRGGQRDLSRPFYSHWLEYDQHCHMPSLHSLKGSLIAVTVWMILWHQNNHQTSHSETLVALSAQYLQSFHICGQRGAWGSQSQLLHRHQKMPWKYNSTPTVVHGTFERHPVWS